MSGLSLISEYSSGSDEESDINSNNEKENIQSPLPLPKSISTWNGVVHHEDVIDDPMQHNGRIRSFKHERGNWATLVYVPYFPSKNLGSWMSNVASVASVNEKASIFDDLHVSLTRTLILKFHWIDGFVAAVRQVCEKFHAFNMELSDVEVYGNDEKTRTFLGLRMRSTCNSLLYLSEALNKQLEEYQLPAFYEEASHHTSFLWTLNDHRKEYTALLPTLTACLHEHLRENPKDQFVHVDRINCKIGNRMYTFPLKQP